MPRNEYQRELVALKEAVCSMADLVLGRYEEALTAYETGNNALADSVIEGDHEVNERYLALEGDCIELFALQQPVAGDLRFIASSFKIVTDLERVGDLATNLAGYAIEAPDPAERPGDIRSLGDEAGTMLRDAVGAYKDEDAAATRTIAARDDDLDDACRATGQEVVRSLIADDPSTLTGAEIEARLEDVSRTLLTIRDIERVGDHAVNVCARTLYMLENDEGLIY